MIGRLRGLLVLKKPPFLVVELGGLGYDVQVPMSTIYQLPPIGSEVILLTHFYVREDLQVLYGFIQEQERTLFRALIKISGVGPKMALAILSGMSVSQFIQCVDQRLVENLMRLPGVGRKTAERLIIEMAGKLALNQGEEALSRQLFEQTTHQPLQNTPSEEAISALIALGYKPSEATKMIQAMQPTEASTEDLIRRALQVLAKGGRVVTST